VTVSLENLPDGVSAPSVQANVTGGYTSTNLTLNASPTAAVGTVTAKLVVNAGGVVTKSDVQVQVYKPSVSVSFPNYSYNSLTVRRGQTMNFTVQVGSQHGFSGSTTINLDGLPRGVTAAPLALTVTPGVTTSATMAVTASDTADYGTATVKVTGDDIDTSSQPQLSLAVASSLTLQLGNTVQIATASNGLWTVGQNGNGGYAYSGNTYGYNYTINRYEGSQLKVSTTFFVSGGSISTPLATPGGDLVLTNSNTAYIVKADGTTSSLILDSSDNYYTNNAPKVVDAQNRLWYASVSNNVAALNTLDLSTGAKAVVSGVTPSNTSFNMYRNTSGSTLYYAANSGNSGLVQIDAATSTKTKDIPLPGIYSVGSLAIAQDGTIWGSSSSIFRVNADGTISTFSSLSSSSKLVFDATDAKTLWAYSGSTVYKIDTTRGTAAPIPFGLNISDIVSDNAGGVWTYGSEYNYSANVSSYNLSLIK